MTETDRLIEITKQARALQEGDLKLRDIVERVLRKQPGTDRLLLVADQWEELYTLTQDEASRRRFIDELLEASRTAPLSVVLTLRGDFVGQALAYRPLSDRPAGCPGQPRADDAVRAGAGDHGAGREGRTPLRARPGRAHPRRRGRGTRQPAAAGVRAEAPVGGSPRRAHAPRGVRVHGAAGRRDRDEGRGGVRRARPGGAARRAARLPAARSPRAGRRGHAAARPPGGPRRGVPGGREATRRRALAGDRTGRGCRPARSSSRPATGQPRRRRARPK